MYREAIRQLYEWKDKKKRKPLIIKGARQVGKTWLMKQFAKEAFPKHVYINFEDNELFKNIFEKDFDINRIVLALQLETGVVIDENTLILFDELQESPRGITALKYFYEKAPQYPIIAAGSLLGIAMHHNDSFPVGKVDFLQLYPLSFQEFLSALGQQQLAELVASSDWEMMKAFHSKIENYLRQYFFIGGMPEVVMSFVENQNFETARALQQNIIETYESDFSKHAPLNEVPRLRMVWRSIPGQLAKENRKFIYGSIKEGARAKDFELSIEWLQDAGLVYKVNRTKKGQLPLSAYEDFAAFKLFTLDIGLLGAMNRLSAKTLLDGNSLYTDYKGALTEQYVLQQLKYVKNLDIYYWSADNSQGEIDFLVQKDDKITPIEVKAEENLQAKSLHAFVDKNEGLKGIRFSMSDYREQNWMTNYPLFAIASAIH